MIDTHCHGLFNVDDASKTLNEAVAMFIVAQEDNISDVLITPHCVPGQYFQNTKEDLLPVFEILKEELKRQHIDINVYLGCELTMTDEAIIWLQQKKVATLNNTDWLLVELPWHTPFKSNYTEDEFIETCINMGYHVLLAHPERYRSVQRDFNTLKRWREMGCFFSVNRTGLLSANTNERALCIRMIKEGYCDVVASDAHNCTTRSITLSDSFDFVQEHFDYATAYRLMVENPRKIIQGEALL